MRKVSTALVVVWVAFWVVACGGETPTPTTTTNNTQPPDAAATTAPSSQPEAGAPQPSIESQRDPFVQGCLAKLAAPEYCNCAFDQFRDVFKGADLSVKPSDAQLANVKQRTVTTCGSKLTEDPVKQSFTSTCVGGETRKAAYCDCAWTGLRKKLEVADFVGDFEGPRFDEAKKVMAAACKGKLPDEVAKSDFMGGCTKSAPAQGKTCECAWKKLRSKGTAEEIAAGLVDLKAPEIEACKKP